MDTPYTDMFGKYCSLKDKICTEGYCPGCPYWQTQKERARELVKEIENLKQEVE